MQLEMFLSRKRKGRGGGGRRIREISLRFSQGDERKRSGGKKEEEKGKEGWSTVGNFFNSEMAANKCFLQNKTSTNQLSS